MGLERVNRRGDKYLLQVGKTKTGKPKYWFGRKLTGDPVEALPDGYEVYEHPQNAQVYLRKAVASPILPIERESLAEGIRRHAGLEHFLVEVEGKGLVVYLADRNPDLSAALIGKLFGADGHGLAGMAAWARSRVRYSKMLRFTLADEDQRLFTAERWCFLGLIDDWFPLSCRPAPLDQLARKYAPHLGKDSFFELM